MLSAFWAQFADHRRSPLFGFLSGRFSSEDELEPGDYRLQGPRFTGENLKQNRLLAERVRELGHRVKLAVACGPALARAFMLRASLINSLREAETIV